MPVLSQYDHIFAIGLIFAFLDAWNIGANDVANAFATSVSSHSLTMRQAMMIASVTELSGAVAVGAQVADTIRTKVVDPKLFEEDPAVLMLGMMCALVGSSIYLTFATKFGMPVSTTHSIMGGVIGFGVAAVGAGNITWGWNKGKGVSSVFAAWVIAPCLAGVFGAILFLITKYAVMRRANAPKAALYAIPIYFALTSGLLTMLMVWKGADARISPTTEVILGSIFGTAAGVAILITIFFLPYVYRKVILGDWTLRPWHVFLGPLLLRRGEVPPKPDGVSTVKDFYSGHLTMEQLEAARAREANPMSAEEKHLHVHSKSESNSDVVVASEVGSSSLRPEGPIYSPKVLFYYVKKGFFHGVDQDVVSAQNKKDLLSGDLEAVHARAVHYDNKAEYMYSFLQVMTAATASFVHGANDVSNAVGPFATIYLVWSTGTTAKETPIPYWVLFFGGIAIVIGLWTYGYNIMRNLGNRITLHSPSRGFSMELGSAITVVMATRLALPVSTTQCITGATAGVGLANGDWRALNWRMILFIYAGWIITLPATALISGCLMAFILNSPRWSS